MSNKRRSNRKTSFVPDSLREASVEQIEELITWLDGIIEKNDLRRHPRKPLNLKGEIVSDHNNALGHREGEVIIKDMSTKGAGFLSNKEIRVGEPCRVQCSVEKNDLTLLLKVVRQEAEEIGFSYGCELLSLEKSSKESA